MNSIKPHARGFTLVEIQIATVLLAFIMLLGYSSLHMAGKSWHAVAMGSERIDEQRIISQFLRTRIEQTIPLMLAGNEQSRLLFMGEQQMLGFVGELPAHRGGGGLYWLRVHQQDSRLMLSYRPLLSHNDIDDTARDSALELIDQLETLEFDYYGAIDADSPPRWHTRWTASTRLPDLVRIAIAPKDSATWPALVIPIRSDMAGHRPERVLHSENP